MCGGGELQYTIFCHYFHNVFVWLRLVILTHYPFSSSGMFKSGWERERKVYKMLKAVTESTLATSGYSEVNLAKLFQAFTTLK